MKRRAVLRPFRLWCFRSRRAEFYRDLAEMFQRNESLMAFLEGEIANAVRTRQAPRETALRAMLERYRAGHAAGRVGGLLEGLVPGRDGLMVTGVARPDDKSRALRALADAVDSQQAMRAVVLGHAAFPLAMVPLCYVLIEVLSEVILSIDRSTPVYVRAELWTGANGWARDLAVVLTGFGLPSVVLFVAALVGMVASLPRWRGRARLAVEGWPVYGLYRDFQGGLLFTSLAMLLSNGATLRAALEDLAQGSSTWLRWHLTRVLRALDDNPNRAIEAFGRGLLSPAMLARASTLHRTAPSFADVLIELGTRESGRVLQAVRRAALAANVAVVGVLVAVCAFLGLSTLTVPGRFSALMEPATLMSLKQAHEARTAGIRGAIDPSSQPQPPGDLP